jgi:PAS domain S-box-containing protein
MTTNLEASQIALDDALRHALDGMFVIDGHRRFVLFSDGCERITGYDRGSILGTESQCHDLAVCRSENGRSLAGELCPSLRIFDGGLPGARQKMRIRHRDGHPVWVETTYSPMYDENGSVACVVGVLRDTTGQKEREDELRSAAQNPGTANASETLEPLSCLIEDDTAMGNQTPEAEAGNRPLDDVLSGIERREILAALRRANGQRTLAAQLLRISRSRLYRRMEALGIDPRTLGPGGEA